MKYKHLLFLSLLIFSLFAEEICDCQLYIDDKDSSGTNIRNAPKGEKILTIPYAKETFHGIKVINSDNGWFQIKSIELESGITVDFSNHWHAAQGAWIHGSLLKTDFSSRWKDGKELPIPLYEMPEKNSKKVLQIETYPSKTRILSCVSGWLEYRVTYKKRVVTGWISPENQCPNPLTTCP